MVHEIIVSVYDDNCGFSIAIDYVIQTGDELKKYDSIWLKESMSLKIDGFGLDLETDTNMSDCDFVCLIAEKKRWHKEDNVRLVLCENGSIAIKEYELRDIL